MGTLGTNSDSLVEHYGTRDATGAHKLASLEEKRDYVEIFDDFLYSGVFEAYSPWILDKDGGATDAVIVSGAEGGAVNLASGSTDNQGVCIVGKAGWIANNGGLTMEAKIKNSAITTTAIFVGFHDAAAVEEPALVDASDAITSAAGDSVVGFVFDTDAATKEWFVFGTIDGGTNATGSGACGTAPTADVYQTLRVEVDSDGAGAKFYIDGAKVGETTSGTCLATDTMYPIVVLHNRAAATRTLTCDWVHVGSNR